jgi:hypothetical protein
MYVELEINSCINRSNCSRELIRWLIKHDKYHRIAAKKKSTNWNEIFGKKTNKEEYYNELVQLLQRCGSYTVAVQKMLAFDPKDRTFPKTDDWSKGVGKIQYCTQKIISLQKQKKLGLN